MQELLVDLITAAVKVFKTTREALAADLREIAGKIEGGAFIADEAFKRAEQTRDDTKDARDKLPPG